ncbi:MAG: exopolyphosphatase, partial [Desulfobacteraceae bacterium]|nr:exopolyphosphatase [Desulfobacteraceae bacterium]
GLVDIKEGDILANLPYSENCELWFDHHYSNRVEMPFRGAFKIAPSAAGIVYEYYIDKMRRNFYELVKETDRIDSADLTMDEVLHPEKYPYLLISMTISGRDKSDEKYWNKLVELLRKHEIADVIEDPEVKKRCNKVIKENRAYKELLIKSTSITEQVAVTDFRSYDTAPVGNRFLVYSLFPETVVQVKIRFGDDKDKIVLSAGHSIFNRNCNVNVGLLLSEFGGGGHEGAGGCSFSSDKASEYIPRIIETFKENRMENNKK